MGNIMQRPGVSGTPLAMQFLGERREMQTELLNVTGMTCGGCTSNVTNALRAIDGVDAVNVSLASGEATVQFDERVTSRDQLQSAVQRAGYGVTSGRTTDSAKPKGGCCG